MIFFFADNHYGAHPGRYIFSALPESLQKQIKFYEDDLQALENTQWQDDCSLLVLHWIGGTCGVEHPNIQAEKQVRSYLERGGNMLLLHGATAAFWQWSWWRKIVGFRWVRAADPDGVAPSEHPVKPYNVNVCNVQHRLASILQNMSLPEDEIYIQLEHVSPALVLMESVIDNKTFPQCWETQTPWGGKLIGFLPGHRKAAIDQINLSGNINKLITFLLEK